MTAGARLRFGAFLLLALFAALGLGSRAAASFLSLVSSRGATEAPFRIENVGPRVVDVEEPAAAAGLRVGDRVTRLQGQLYVGRKVLARLLASMTPGQALELNVEGKDPPAGARSLSVLLVEGRRPGTRAGLFSLGLYVFLPLFCALLGFLVVLRRLDDPRAWLLLVLLLGFATPFLDSGDPVRFPAWLRLPGIAFQSLLSPTWGLWMFLFALSFPERARMDRRWPWLKWVVGVPLGVFAILNTVVEVGASEAYASVAGIAAFVDRHGLALPARVLGMVAVAGFFAVMGEQSGTLPSPDSRRRLRLLGAGTFVSFTPMLVIVLTSLVKGKTIADVAPSWLLVPALLAFALFPITLAYVIVVERALDVGMVIRQGLQYALARNGVLVLQFLISAGVIFTVASLAADPGANRPERIRSIAMGVAAVFLMRIFAQRARGLVDRRFFREAYDTERLLTDLADDVRTIVEIPKLLDTVAHRLSDTLHVPRVAAFLKRDGGFVLEQAVGLGPSPEASFSEDAAVIARLRENAGPLVVYPEDPRHWAHELEERATLLALHAQLLIPLLLKGRMLGLLSLGPKLSEEAYSASDIRLLGSVGAQVALALENGRLTEAVASEVARRERMNRELEIAREVQERLFPQELPSVRGLDYAGYCRPARGVGGDYYDFLALSGGRAGQLGLAIGDVSGKGIPAALLMASLQASLRGQVTFGPVDLAEVMARVNRLICDASSANRYATFFYAEFDPATRRLVYVNAGHNAPMLLRADGSVERLDQGGPVVGLLEIASYQAAEVGLRAGDRLLAYTDGLSEAMSPSDEEWGEDRLLEAFRGCEALPAAATVERLIVAADAFASGAPQHDDMTALVARLLP